ncbi:Thiamine biosynthesis lipoprotein ApbE precursor [Pseudoalteromonas sp. P1-9]|uniref:FAD:protein FMN transferase n=1 Tax=Pseudoalteromonas sp. P1-9 TaxID=1710354 RepID=UPI0007079C22|nr:FAD:protein FMN transferase [Pseudoalteromonas sp. P1-9]KPV94259.1 Thiamine biosynthesis lipoprotein ApbE precursor [Pseudoalteromonas sp. P1-9]
MRKLLLILLIFPIFCYGEWLSDEKAIMGTSVKITLWHHDKSHGEAAIKAVFDEMERINQLMSPYINSSELYSVNKNAAIQPVKISNELYLLIKQAQLISAQTKGAFDITFASVGFLYNYRERISPSNQVRDTNQALIDYRQVELNDKNQTVHFRQQGMKIDLGGIAKGYAVDNAISILQSQGIDSALVSAGGDTKALGKHGGRPWLLAIQDPRKKGKHAIQLPMENEAISTSGDYERYFIQDGVRHHHIIDPKTGHSAAKVQSVSIIGQKGVMTDALSTSVFVLGVKDGLALINSMPNFEALIIDKDRKLHFSSGLLAH